jgi:hypothetical protein
MDEALRQEVADEVAKQVRAFVADVSRIWDEFGRHAAWNHAELPVPDALAAGFGDVLRIAAENQSTAA